MGNQMEWTYETETLSNDTPESTDTTGGSSTAAEHQRDRLSWFVWTHKYIAAHMYVLGSR